MITKSKPSQRLGAVPPDPCTWDLLIGIGTPPEKFLPTPLLPVIASNQHGLYHAARLNGEPPVNLFTVQGYLNTIF